MKNKTKKRLIVVLGMHRSGTSATTRALQALGVDLGDNLLPGIVGNNEKGFWEDLDINKLNIKLLQFLSHDWHTLVPIPYDELKNKKLAAFRLKAIELLREKTKSVSTFGMKDPRMTKLLPFWQEVFNHCKFDVCYIIAIRNPLSVAKSLNARDRFAEEKSHYMWLVNVLPSILETDGNPRVVVDYDRLMDKPSIEIMRIAQSLGLADRINPDEIQKFEHEFLEERLRHTRYQPEDLKLDPIAPTIVIEVYGTLLQVAHDILPFDSAEVKNCLAQATAHLKEIYPALRYMTRQEEQIASLNQNIAGRDEHFVSLKQTINERDGQIVELGQAVAERDEQISSLNQAVAERDGQINSLNQAVGVWDEQFVSLSHTITERDGVIASLNQVVAERDGQIVGLNQAVAGRDVQITSLNQVVAGRDEQIASLNQVVTERDGQIVGLNQAVAGRDVQIASLNQVVAERDGQIVGLNQAVAGRDVQIASLNQVVAEQDKQIASLNQAVAGRDVQIASLNQVVAEQDKQIASLNQAVAGRDEQIASLNQVVTERDGQIVGLNQVVAGRDGQIVSLNMAVAGRDEQISSLNQAVAERDGQISSLNQAVAERDGQIVSLNMAVAGRDEQISSLNQAVAERDGQINSLNQAAAERDEQIDSMSQTVTERDKQISALNQTITDRDKQIGQILSSYSWRITLPLREGLLWLTNPSSQAKRYFRGIVSIISAELARVMSSRFWNVTMPFRFAGRFLRGDWAVVRASIISFRKAKGNSFVTEEDTAENKDVILKGEASTPLNKQNMSLEKTPFRGKRILLVSYYYPSRAHAGGLRILDIYSLIKSAFPNVQIDLYTHKRPVIDWSYAEVEKLFDNIFLSPVENLSLSGFNQLRNAASQYDVIDLQFHESAYDIESWRRVGQKIIFTPMESLLRGLLIALRYRDIFSVRKMLTNIKLAKEELIFAKKADEVVCVSKKDASSLRMFCHARKVCALETAVSNIEFTDAFDHRCEDITPELKQPIILYIAYFGSETNISALKWYLKNVHPLINNALSEYRLQVVGRGDLSIFKEYQSHSIAFIGEVPKLTPYIRGAKVGIAPALNGGGFRGKINQYSIYGVPVVASKIAAKGLVYQDGHDIFITDQARQFAKQCIRLLRENDLNKAMGQRAREKAFAQYTWGSKMDAIKKIYNLEVV